MKIKPLHATVLLLVTWLFLTNSFNPNNPPIGRTGAPGELTCAASDCHTGGSFTGMVAISGVPDTVNANQNYTITLSNVSNASRAGFQLTCLDNSNAYVGTLTNGTGTSMATNFSNNRKYIRQSSPKNLVGGSTSWSFTWKAPATASGDLCKFYFVSLCADNSGSRTGDNVLVANKQVVLRNTSNTLEAPEAAKSWVEFQAPLGNKSLKINLLKSKKGRLEIFDMQGKAAQSNDLTSENLIDIATLPTGIYVATITAEGRVTAIQFFQD